MSDFDTEFCEVRYVEADGAVFLRWKKFARLDDYRKPTMFALELIRAHNAVRFIVDARNGFEDDKRDVEWGFSYLLPEIAKTACRFVCFILTAENLHAIGDEMDMWTVEFGKYFAVTKSADYESAVASTKECVLMTVRYTVADGKRNEFYEKLKSNDIIWKSRAEAGNIRYDYYLPMDSENDICLLEMWTNIQAQLLHTKSEHFALLGELKKQYVKNVKIEKYAAQTLQ